MRPGGRPGKGLAAYGYALDPAVREIFTRYRKTHNDGVFDAYPADVLAARRASVITGLPDAYGRGRIIGDYRRVPLYGVARLIAVKQAEKAALDARSSTAEIIRDREELAEQIRALGELAEMAASYGHDVTRPAATAQEAIQWLYLAYLAAVKEQNGAAMSLGRTSTFVDIYLERDLRAGRLTEQEAQELVDDFVIKLRIVRFLRTPEYDQLFSGDPTWVTESIGGIGRDGRPLVTRTSFRYLQTLYNLGPAPEPNLTVLWSPALPEGFKRFCAQVSVDTSSIQYESDDLLRSRWGDDTAIACCVSAMEVGKQMQFFGARVNLAKTLLYAINGGRDEMSGAQVGPALPPLTGDVLDYAEVMARFAVMMDWLAKTYVDALNVIHYMHDKYAYERLEMALHDYGVLRTMACGIAGLSVTADSLAAIKYATVRPVRDETGLVVDYRTEGEFPVYGNDDDRADEIAVWLVHVHGPGARAQDVPGRAAHPVGADHHLQRRLRQAHRQHTGRPAGWRAVRARGEPDERPRPVHSWDLSTGVDGPGTRFVVFTAGCPLRCAYCHNPDTWQERNGRQMSAAALLARAARFRPFIAAAGGGLTVSGGEPLLQPAFTRAILAGAKELGLHTALDTSGYLGTRADDELLDATDLVLLDIKSFDPAIARTVTGRGIAPTLTFARRLAARRQPVWVRFVLVPGWTDDPGNVAALAKFTASLGNVERVDVLPFHTLGTPKYAALGLDYPCGDVTPPDEKQITRVRAAFTAAGLNAV